MKKILCIGIALMLLLTFAACTKEDKPSETSATSTTATTTAAASTAPTAKVSTTQATTAKATDISFIYSGYWYENSGNKVTVYRFEKSGAVTASTYRRKNIGNDSDEPDMVLTGTCRRQGDTTLLVCPDSDAPDEIYTYTAANGALQRESDDPEGAGTNALQNFDKLSKDYARSMLLGDN